MPIIDTILIKVASRCNLNCDYCYVYRMGDDGWKAMPGRMSSITLGVLAERLEALAVKQNAPFAVVLHGGEPLLLGVRLLATFFEQLRVVLPAERFPFSIQTNGVLLTDEIVEVGAKYRVSFSISLDGPAQVHNKHRYDHKGADTHARVLEAIERLLSHREGKFLFAGVLAVIDPTFSAREVYTFFKDIGVPSVDFLYRDGNHSLLPVGKRAFVSTEYGLWLASILNLYLTDASPSYRIRVLDDMIRLVLGAGGRKEGLGLDKYGILIVDTDGTIQKNDILKSSFNHADRFEQPWSIHSSDFIDVINSGEFTKYYDQQAPTAKACLECEFLGICGGGIVSHRWSAVNSYDNPSVYCIDQKYLITRIKEQLAVLLPAVKLAA